MSAPALREKVCLHACHRCGCCLAPQQLVPWALESDHIIPMADGGSDDEKIESQKINFQATGYGKINKSNRPKLPEFKMKIARITDVWMARL